MPEVIFSSDPLHVVVGVILKDNLVCITQRHINQHQGGLWEFPGGKVEEGEATLPALKRELKEELGIDVLHASPLLTINYPYPDKHVLLDVWFVHEFTGHAVGMEGQALKWQRISRLDVKQFPAANRTIISALNLPRCYVITGDYATQAEFDSKLTRCLQDGQRLIQLRVKNLPPDEYLKLANHATTMCHKYGAKIVLNADSSTVLQTQADGIHLTSRAMLQTQTRPLDMDKLVAASVHTLAELSHAITIGVDFVVVAPVLATTSHPEATPMGWEGLQLITRHSSVIVYALGGMNETSLAHANASGAYGIAGISGFWNNEEVSRNATSD